MGGMKTAKTHDSTSRLYDASGSMSSSKELLHQRSSSSLFDTNSENNHKTATTAGTNNNNRPYAICQLVTSVMCCVLVLFAVILFNHIYSDNKQLDVLRQYYDAQFQEQQDQILLLQTKHDVYVDRLKIVEDLLKRDTTLNDGQVRINQLFY